MEKEKHKSKEELDDLAKKVVAVLRNQNLPLWQAKEILSRAKQMLDLEVLT